MSLETELNHFANLKDLAINEEALDVNGQKAKTIFCNGWPAAKLVVEAIRAMLPKGFGIVIAIVIKAGDALSARICN